MRPPGPSTVHHTDHQIYFYFYSYYYNYYYSYDSYFVVQAFRYPSHIYPHEQPHGSGCRGNYRFSCGDLASRWWW